MRSSSSKSSREVYEEDDRAPEAMLVMLKIMIAMEMMLRREGFIVRKLKDDGLVGCSLVL